jgi:hypothetical protein
MKPGIAVRGACSTSNWKAAGLPVRVANHVEHLDGLLHAAQPLQLDAAVLPAGRKAWLFPGWAPVASSSA